MPEAPATAGWAGWKVDALDGDGAGRVHGVYADALGGEPVWLVTALAGPRFSLRRRPVRLVAIPLHDCAGAAGHVWVAHEREAIGTAPMIDPTRPLLREHEIAICSHYGIGKRIGRHAEIVVREEGSITAQPV